MPGFFPVAPHWSAKLKAPFVISRLTTQEVEYLLGLQLNREK